MNVTLLGEVVLLSLFRWSRSRWRLLELLEVSSLYLCLWARLPDVGDLWCERFERSLRRRDARS